MNAMKASAIVARVAAAFAAATASVGAVAADYEPERWQLNMPRGVTVTAHNAYEMHMLMLWICVAIGVVVFAAMAVAIVKFRKSAGAKPDVDFTHSTKLELLWTTIPVLILVIMAVPATKKVLEQYDTSGSEMVVKVTGYQWMWRYEVVRYGDRPTDVNFISRLDRRSDRIRQSGEDPNAAGHEHYLRDVDNVLVLPTDTKIRFVFTSDDVIHAWWVPALGWKQDAIPGVINDAWTNISTPGTYRGVCAELCGKDHGFMPIVVKAVPRAEYEAWLAAHEAGDLAEAARIAATDAPAIAGGSR
jgi:cytochrome c oxidase subunit 2